LVTQHGPDAARSDDNDGLPAQQAAPQAATPLPLRP